ncbi:hypothetical protein [Modestobacter sp. URMC 112]
MQAWHSLSRKWRTSIGTIVTLATVLATWDPINDGLIQPIVHFGENRQPARDEGILAELRAGILFSEFQRILKAQPVAILNDHIDIQSHASGPVRDEIFMLPTAYVEAFVDRNQVVVAYTVTARGDELPTVKTSAGSVHLGHTSVKDAPNGSTGVQNVAFVCGAHIEAYYEITGTNLAQQARTYAYGYTGAGGRPEGYKGPSCPPGSSDLLLDPAVAEEAGESEHYMVDVYGATETFLQQATRFRTGLIINTVTVTAPSVPIVPQMLSLHPETVTSLDPSSNVY